MGYKHRHSFIILLLTALYLPTSLPAQNNRKITVGERESEIRSIDKMIISLQADTISPEENFTVFCKILKRSIEISYVKGKAESYHNIGHYFMKKRKYAQAVRFFLSSLQLFTILKDTSAMMTADLSMFSVEMYLKDYENALSNCKHGLEMARQTKDRVRTGIFFESM